MQFSPSAFTGVFHKLLRELGDLLNVLGVQEGGEEELALSLYKVLTE